MENLIKVANLLETSLIKEGAKDRVSRNKVNKMLEKAKTEYGKLKSSLDNLEDQDSKLQIQLTNTRHLTNEARQRVIKLHKAIQSMDLASATDAIFYNDDSSDIGYIIRGKEYHLDINDAGDMVLHPMRQFRSERKSKNSDAQCADDCVDLTHSHESADKEELTEEALDSLYNSLLSHE